MRALVTGATGLIGSHLVDFSLSDFVSGGFYRGERRMAEDDGQLLQDYASRGSERAFGELVARHIDMVYTVALRLVRGDVHLAQDVAQTVLQREAELANALSPPELDALRLHESPAARYVLKYLPEAQSEEEFRLMVQAADEVGIEAPKMSLARMMPFGFSRGLLPLDTEDEDRQQAEKEAELKGRLRELLGEQRVAELALEMQTQPPVENPFNIQAFK